MICKCDKLLRLELSKQRDAWKVKENSKRRCILTEDVAGVWRPEQKSPTNFVTAKAQVFAHVTLRENNN